MKDMQSNNKRQWLPSGAQSDTNNQVEFSVDEGCKHMEKPEQFSLCESESTPKKETVLPPSDETADISESDSDVESELSFSITPYPNSYCIIPAKNNREHEDYKCMDELVELRQVTPYPSSEDLKEEDSLLKSRESSVDLIEKKRSSFTRGWYGVVIALLVAVLSYRYTQRSAFDRIDNRDTIYVPGAGFSGFWFTLGRLHSIAQPERNDYYCFSAGCLGVVASLRNFTVEETLGIALNIQERWKTGQIKRHDVVGEFVDTLVDTESSTMSNLLSVEESKVLDRMHIITSTKEKWFGMTTHIRSPRTRDELREMLLQTTWM